MTSTYPGNFNYLRDILDIHPNEKQFELCMNAMEKYPVPWWFMASSDNAAANQFDEPVLLISMSKFKEGIEKVIGRTINVSEITKDNSSLKKEFFDNFATAN